MGEFTRTSGAEGSHSDHLSDSGSGFAALGLEPETVTPEVVSAIITPDAPLSDATSSDAPSSAERASAVPSSAVPLTRRELRAREKAAAETEQHAAEHVPAEPAPAAAAPDVAQAPLSIASEPVAIVSEIPSLDVKAPKKPNVLRPVRLPRGLKRPRAAAPVTLRVSSSSSPHKPFKRQIVKKMMTMGAMVGAGLMIVATSIPANAFYSSDEATGAVSAPAEVKVQSISVEPAASLRVSRDGYTATSFREQIFLRYGNRSFLYTNNANGTIQWPFPIAVPISDPFGPRSSPCGGCSSFHKGVDFTPGAGAVIQAIADGVVSAVIPSHAGLGNHVIIDHMINGQLVQSVYGHMLDDSIRVVVGQVVKVKDEIGLVGSTGESTGPHLHFEIHINGEPIDGFEWLKNNAN